MDKIVGKYWLIGFLLYCGSCFGASISMRVLDMDGLPIEQAGAGRPFIIELSMADVSHMGQPPVIAGVETFDVKNAGMRIMTVNGKSTSKYLYEVRIDKTGSYLIGPATFTQNNQKLISNTVSIVVGKEQIGEQRDASRVQKHSPVLLRLSVDHDRAVVGERITCSLRFYLVDPDISVRQLIEQESKDFRKKNVRGPKQGTEFLDGVEYSYIEWKWDVYPHKTGSYVIPAYGADYDREIERDDFWGGLGRFMGNRIETKRVYSNAVLLVVDELPKTDKQIQGIGSFTALNMIAKPSVAKQGEGVVVAVEVIGDGDPDSIIFSELKGIPKSLKYYDSKQVALESSGKEQTGKRFEFIVQGLKTGSWKIPAQSFYYYDVRQRVFKELHSAPLTITVMPGAVAQSSFMKDGGADQGGNESDLIADIHDGPWYPVRSSRMLPWWLFLLLVFGPIGWMLYRMFGRFFQRRARVNYRAKRASNAFRAARQRLARCKQKNDLQRLYRIFIELFADRWHMSVAAISAPYIEKRLQDIGMNKEQSVEWKKFFSDITERAFGSSVDKEEILLSRAKQWIDQLEALL